MRRSSPIPKQKPKSRIKIYLFATKKKEKNNYYISAHIIQDCEFFNYDDLEYFGEMDECVVGDCDGDGGGAADGRPLEVRLS